MSTDIDVTPATRGGAVAQPRRWLALVFLSLAQLIIALDATVMNIALPSAQAALGFSDTDRQWVITAYTLAFGGLLLLGGRIADLVGRRRAFLVGLLGFAAASAVGGAATGLPLLIAARATQGACAALLAPTVLSALAVTFSQVGERAKAFAVFGAIAGGGGAVGLVLGGVLTDNLGWRWCLYVNVPMAVAAATGGWLLLTGDRGARGRRLDTLSALLVTSAMVAVVYGCTRATSDGWGSPRTFGLFAAAALLLALFVLRESRVDSPLLPLRILHDRNRAGAYLSVAAAVAGISSLFLLLTYYLQVVLGYSPTRAGLAFLPLSGAVLLSSQAIGARLLPRVAPRLLIVPGLLLAAAATAVLIGLPAEGGYLARVLPAEILLGLGVGCVFVPAINLASQRVDRRDAGVAAAVVNTSQQVGGSIGVAAINTAAASATVTFLATHPDGIANYATALVHGYHVAAASATGLFVAAALAGAALINATVAPPDDAGPRPE
jgi:EmrB/QacA subfamily drug resistance transporter